MASTLLPFVSTTFVRESESGPMLDHLKSRYWGTVENKSSRNTALTWSQMVLKAHTSKKKTPGEPPWDIHWLRPYCPTQLCCTGSIDCWNLTRPTKHQSNMMIVQFVIDVPLEPREWFTCRWDLIRSNIKRGYDSSKYKHIHRDFISLIYRSSLKPTRMSMCGYYRALGRRKRKKGR